MTRRFAPALLLTLAGLLAPWPARADEEQQPSRARLGERIPNLTFARPGGKDLALHDFKEQKAVVLVFLSFDCPISNSYSQPLAEIHKEFGPYGVSILGLTTNEEQSPEEVDRQAKEFKLPFPVVLDKGLKAADALQADVTPEVFVLDNNFVLRYRGRIDNQYYARLKRAPDVTAQDLHQVLGELMSGREVTVATTVPSGCPIPRDLDEPATDNSVTFHRDVLPILQNNCQSCHRPGEVGPFALLTYRQARAWADDIKTFTQQRLMPPWKPTEGVAFHNERKLSDAAIATLAKWADAGSPAGDPKDAPAPRQFPTGWQLGTPDLVLEVPAEFQVGPAGHDVFRCFVLPTNLPEDKFIGAVEVRPGNTAVVHHALLFIDKLGQARKLEKDFQDKAAKGEGSHPQRYLTDFDKGPGYSVSMGVGFIPQGGMGGWAPGLMPRYLPGGVGYHLPKGADVVLQVHYHRTGRPESDRTRVGLYFSKAPSPRLIQGHALAGGAGGTGPLRLFFVVPKDEPRFKLAGSLWATGDCELLAVTPHMHKLGKQIKVTVTPPDAAPFTLIALREWDYDWQETYMLREPLRVKAGTRLDVEAYYDNTAANPNNPNDPPRNVFFGEQTTNEMCFVFLGGTSARPGPRLPFTSSPPAKDKQ